MRRLARSAMGVTTAITVMFPIRTMPGGASSASMVMTQYTSAANISAGMVSVPKVTERASLFVSSRQTAVIALATSITPVANPTSTRETTNTWSPC